MDFTMNLPDETTMVVRDARGVELFKDEVVFLEGMLIESQKGVDVSDTRNRPEWLSIYARMLNAKYEVELTETHAWAIACKVLQLAGELKKSLSPSLASAESTTSVPSTTKESPTQPDTTS